MTDARQTLMQEAAKRVLISDGAFGTQIQNRKLTEADYAGDLNLPADQKGNNDILALTRPDVIADITRAYLDAGSDIVSTNTFSANTISQADYKAEDKVDAINVESARIARELADELVVLEAGRVVQRGTPDHVAFRPATEFVAALTAGLIERDDRSVPPPGMLTEDE